ncbi:hypothetical protein Dcar01_00490 [Deinococcus carri]|uniref:DUF2243 domain-containing protein n=1 Tax=Deinococcus carri TaxID=1211323 RepID=A0ABP9W6L0_9DEIO
MTTAEARAEVRNQEAAARRSRWGGVLLGLGIGGFFDGIVIHQLLQWHHMVSALHPPDTLENLRLNTVADGLFHVAAYGFMLLGIFLLWSGTREPHPAWRTSVFVGTLLFGFGLFNVVEGLIDHQLLGVHHVRPGPHWLAYDIGFLVWGAVMLLGGWGLMRSRR